MTQFQCGMAKLVLQSAALLMGTLTAYGPLLTLLIATMPLQHPLIRPSFCLTQLLFSLLPLVANFHLIFMHCQTQRVGSETQKAVYYIGYQLTVAEACIHQRSSQCPEHPTFALFPLILTILSLGPLGLMFSTLYGLKFLFLALCACRLPVVVVVWGCRSFPRDFRTYRVCWGLLKTRKEYKYQTESLVTCVILQPS